MKNLVYTLIFGLAWICTGCSDFLESQTPQGSVDEEQLQDPVYIDNLVISAYAVWISAEDINSSFSLWNYDVRRTTLTRAVTVRKTAMCSMR